MKITINQLRRIIREELENNDHRKSTLIDKIISNRGGNESLRAKLEAMSSDELGGEYDASRTIAASQGRSISERLRRLKQYK